MCWTESPEAASMEAPATACMVYARGPRLRAHKVPSAEGINERTSRDPLYALTHRMPKEKYIELSYSRTCNQEVLLNL